MASRPGVHTIKEEKREDMRSFLKPLLTIAAMALGMTAGATLPAWALVELNVNKGDRKSVV